jgi:hypothetical protein
MTLLDVLFRYESHPTETAMAALGRLHEVYGIRKIRVDEEWKTIRVEYDATRLSTPTVLQMLRGTGIAVVEQLPLLPPQEASAS